jgi:hypothetical protein
MLLFAVVISTKASAQETQKVTYYYYPSSNVYYNVSSGEYWYYDDGTTNWKLVKTLPTIITLEKAPRYTVYYNGSDVWKDNAAHLQKYKGKKGGEVKAKKPKDNKE